MAAAEPLCCLIGLNPRYLTKEEGCLLEAELFRCICDELKEVYRSKHKDFFGFIKISKQKEDEMLEKGFISFVIKDILTSGEYTLQGFAEYADTPAEVIYDVVSGINTNPSALLLRRIIDLHRKIRSDLYGGIIKKIATQYLQITKEQN